MASGEKANAQLFNDLVLADDHLAEFGGELVVSFPKLVNGRDIVIGQ